MKRTTKGHEAARRGKRVAIFATAILLVLLSIQSANAQKLRLEIGEKLPESYLKKQKKNHLLAIHPSHYSPFFETKIDGVVYAIAFDKETKEIWYIQTSDEQFVTKDGFRVDKEIEIKGSAILIYPYWDVYGPRTKDGWWPVVGHIVGPSKDFFTNWKPDEKRTVAIDAFVKSRYLRPYRDDGKTGDGNGSSAP
ncbi:MAG: hypothetical protein DWQ47_07835 [Acidobacteria bacterium]|nr:MAG: hypothetical protein DWQ32_15935 [Acidobacteriota bacterium]REJ99172.1 MAG: hypothetical protein DWQ38_14040 [Acidobacteriota bacterium]REK16107.1 MAG: hypothetical protein DWQ43_03645 [Acidobacteriota bacterium]REK43788.1 MAG: hypothetical protein DWQ47_07835 [Acidobacteriota bacterium]